MNAGLPTSVGLHVGLVMLALFSWGRSTPEAIPTVDAIEVTISDTTQMRLGEKTAKPKDEIVAKETQAAKQERAGERAGASKQEEPPPPPPQAKPEQVASIPKEEPKPEPPKPEAKPVAKVEPPKPVEKAPALKAPEIAKEPPPPKPPEKKEPPKDSSALDKLMKDVKPKDEPKTQLASAPPAKTPPATQPSTAKSEFSSSAMKDIINKNATGTAQAATAQQASLGTRTGQNAKVAMTASEMAAFKAKVQSCWTVPPGSSEAALKVTMRVMLKPDGTLSAEPEVANSELSARSEMGAYVRSIVRALKQCQPYDMLPADKYADWRDNQLTFVPDKL